MVDRTAMIQYSPTTTEGDAYLQVLMLLQDLCGKRYHVCCGYATDEWLGFEVYERLDD